MIHSPSAKPKAGGILVAVRENFASQHDLRWSELVPGRLLHVRFFAQQQQVDVLAIYQHVRVPGSKSELDRNIRARETVWGRLRKCLSSLPERSYIVLAGDFNTSFPTSMPTTGPSAAVGVQADAHMLESSEVLLLLEQYGLVVLNTFAKRRQTFFRPGGSSMIDFVCVRKSTADTLSRRASAVSSPMAGWRKGGHRPVLASLQLDWLIPSVPQSLSSSDAGWSLRGLASSQTRGEAARAARAPIPCPRNKQTQRPGESILE